MTYADLDVEIKTSFLAGIYLHKANLGDYATVFPPSGAKIIQFPFMSSLPQSKPFQDGDSKIFGTLDDNVHEVSTRPFYTGFSVTKDDFSHDKLGLYKKKAFELGSKMKADAYLMLQKFL